MKNQENLKKDKKRILFNIIFYGQNRSYNR